MTQQVYVSTLSSYEQMRFLLALIYRAPKLQVVRVVDLLCDLQYHNQMRSSPATSMSAQQQRLRRTLAHERILWKCREQIKHNNNKNSYNHDRQYIHTSPYLINGVRQSPLNTSIIYLAVDHEHAVEHLHNYSFHTLNVLHQDIHLQLHPSHHTGTTR